MGDQSMFAGADTAQCQNQSQNNIVIIRERKKNLSNHVFADGRWPNYIVSSNDRIKNRCQKSQQNNDSIKNISNSIPMESKPTKTMLCSGRWPT